MIKWIKDWIWAWRISKKLYGGPGRLDKESKEIILEREAKIIRDGGSN